MQLLSGESWIEVGFNPVALAFLVGEWDKWPQYYWPVDKRLITHADLNNAGENGTRALLLVRVRGLLLERVPPDTRWFEVKYLRDSHLEQLLVIGRCGFIALQDDHALRSAAKTKSTPLRTQPSAWAPPVLWGHERNGPFTILEGNHRLTAYARYGANLV